MSADPIEIDWIGVVVPAHNEQDLLPSCLAGLRAAAAAVSIPVEVVVVLDSCSDGSRFATGSTRSIAVQARNVGAARRAGFDDLLARRSPVHPEHRAWLSTTDADTVVPADWLLRMMAHAKAGWEAVAGTVRVIDWAEHKDEVRTAWENGYDSGDHHAHVHGANLGFRADAYRRVGGMPSLALSEDESLVNALELAGCRVLRAGDLPVVTSARRLARASGGFSDFLRELSA